MNKVQLVGRIARNLELKTTQSGIATLNLTVACQRKVKNANGQYDSDFINCVAWRQTAEFIAKHFSKGERIGLTGTIQTRTYDAQDGSKRYVTEVMVEDAEFVESKGTSTSEPKQESAPAQQPMQMQEADEDYLPFE